MTKEDVKNYIAKWYGQFCNFDNAYGCQCKDLFSQYNHDLVGAPYIVGNPIDLWNHTPAVLLRFYTKIPNSLTFIPKLGDVVIITAGATGHIGICVEGGWLTYKSLDQNFPGDIGLKTIPVPLRAGAKDKATGFPCQFVKHSCSVWATSYRLLGVFRPKSLV
jgi:hypothetical protein